MMRYVFFVVLWAVQSFVFAQNLQFARSIIDTLASSYFAGRGYADSGLFKTAVFLEQQFQNAGLSRWNGSFIQSFTIPMNVISNAELSVKQHRFEPGYDFVVNVRSSGLKGTFKTYVFKPDKKAGGMNSSKIKKYKNSVVIFPPSMLEQQQLRDQAFDIIFSDQFGAAAYILGTTKTPVWDVQFRYPILSYPVITMKGTDDFFGSLKSITINISHDFHQNFQVSNIAGYFPGAVYPDSFIVFCAHYDHLGKMGSAFYPGANDNASGVAMLLDFIQYYSDQSNRLPCSVVFLALTAEEAGILGASYFVKNSLFPLNKIRFLINLDIIGTGSEGIQVVNGSVFDNEFSILLQLNENQQYLPQILSRGEACNSDHCPFYKKGVPSFFIYTLDKNYQWYHVPDDSAQRLPLTAYENLFKLIRDFTKELCR